MSLTCPSCGGEPRRQTTRFGVRHSCCGLWSWGSKPLVDRETHEARQAAHAAFDRLWQSGRVRRARAYRLLQNELGLSPDDCHMALMDAETARRVPEAVKRIEASL
jgi:hypothetical protein